MLFLLKLKKVEIMTDALKRMEEIAARGDKTISAQSTSEMLSKIVKLDAELFTDLKSALADLKAELEKDKDRLDWLSAILRSDNVEVGIALYAGSKLVDTVCKHLVWVSSFSGCGIDNDYFDFDDDFGDGLTLREAIDAAIAQQKGNHE